MARACIGLGSNLGNGRKNLLRAWEMLVQEAGHAVALSSPFLTEPVGMESDYLFTNAVGLLDTALTPAELLDTMLAVEAGMGRDRQKGKDRTVDLDLLFFDDLVLETERLVLPHPEIGSRLFVLAPLAEVAPELVHPVLKETATQMLGKLNERRTVQRISWEDA